MTAQSFGDVTVQCDGHVGVVELHRPPHNFFDAVLLGDLVRALAACDEAAAVRAVVLAAEGRSFCAGTDFGAMTSGQANDPARAAGVYEQALKLFATAKPIVAAVQGPAIGGGLGLALTADFRIAAPEARFAASFVKLGIHPGFGLTCTLPRLIGAQQASLLLLTGRRVDAHQAAAWGLVDAVVPADALRQAAIDLAAEIAQAAPLAVQATRATLRHGLAEAVKAQLGRELAEQTRLRATDDHREGVRAVSERRPATFVGR